MASDDLRARVAEIRTGMTETYLTPPSDVRWLLGEVERLGAKVEALEACYEGVAADALAHGLCSLKEHGLVQRSEKAEAERDVALARLASARELHRPEPFEAIIADQDERSGDVCSVCQELWPCPTVQALDDPPRGLSAPYCGAYMTEWVCTLPSGRHPGWRHVDCDGNWWDQTRCPTDCGEPAYRHAANGCPEGPE